MPEDGWASRNPSWSATTYGVPAKACRPPGFGEPLLLRILNLLEIEPADGGGLLLMPVADNHLIK